MGYNVQPLRSQQEINDFLFCLRRNKNAERDVFLFLIGINCVLQDFPTQYCKEKVHTFAPEIFL